MPEFDKAALAWNLQWDVDWVTAVSWVGTSRQLVAANRRGEVLMYELPDKSGGEAPKPVRKLVGHTNCVNRLISTKDGKRLYSCSHDHSIRVWDVSAEGKGEETIALNAVTRDDLKRRGGKMPAALEAKVTKIECAQVFEGHKEWIQSMCLSRDEKLLVSGDDGGNVITHDAVTGKELSRFKVKAWVYAVGLSPDNKTVVVTQRKPLVFDSGRMEGVRLYDRETGKPDLDLSATFKGQYMAATAWSNDGKLLALGRGGECDGNNGIVTLLEPETGKKVHTLTPGHLNGLTDLLFLPDGKHLATTGRDTVVSIWSLADGKRVAQLGKPRGGQFKDWLHALSVTPDSKWLAAGDMIGATQVWTL